jgi:adenosylcobinamide-GDP ribazoletransferase
MRIIRNITAAFQFLTILPVPVKTELSNLRQSMVFFPLVGVVVGLITGFGYRIMESVFHESIASVLTILVYIILTRALHLDGFMDTIDGFFSHKDRDAVLRILKDPGSGSFAVLGIGIWFLVMFSSLPMLKPTDYIFIHTFTRLSTLLMPLVSGYPRESGTGKFFVENVKGRIFLGALAITAAMAAVLYLTDSPLSPGNMADPKKAAVFMLYGGMLVLSLVVAAFISLWSKRKIGGITGDILGFNTETGHLVLVLAIPVASKLFLG